MSQKGIHFPVEKGRLLVDDPKKKQDKSHVSNWEKAFWSVVKVSVRLRLGLGLGLGVGIGK